MIVWSGLLDSNQRPHRPERRALPTALNPDICCKGTLNNGQHQQKKTFLSFFERNFPKNLQEPEKSITFAPANDKSRFVKVGAIAQLVEQRTENPCVPGSIPGGTTSLRD